MLSLPASIVKKDVMITISLLNFICGLNLNIIVINMRILQLAVVLCLPEVHCHDVALVK